MMDPAGPADHGTDRHVCVRRPRITVHRRPVAGDVCFLDRRDADWEQERSGLQSYGKSRVAWPFEALFGSPRCWAEVASVYAEVFHGSGTDHR
jgi:hypothetical protein